MSEPFSRADVLVDADSASTHRAQVAVGVVRDEREGGYAAQNTKPVLSHPH